MGDEMRFDNEFKQWCIFWGFYFLICLFMWLNYLANDFRGLW